jgi:hypothetical protein
MTREAPLSGVPRIPSKTLATWIALLGGSLGLHHFYVASPHRWLGWLYPLPTLAGLVGAVRMHELGVDDRLAWLLVPLLGATLSIGMLCAIVMGLTPDGAWARRHGGDEALRRTRRSRQDDEDDPPPGIVHTGWGPVLGVILALMVGGGVLMGTIAFSVQKIFEWGQ